MTAREPGSGDPAETGRGTPVDGVVVRGALSPTALAEFRGCALRYRLRRLDRIPEPLSTPALRGTLVHTVLERLFDLVAAERTPARAHALVPLAWESLALAEPGALDLVADDGLEVWLGPCHEAVERYFSVEDPTRLEPLERELYVEALLDSRLLLRGVLDRLDEGPDGALRVVDYKTGRSPGPGFEQRALTQLRFYALVLWRSRGVVPHELRLTYLGDGQVITYSPDVEELQATERLVRAAWQAIETATASGVWEPQPGAGCRWCSFQELCPAFGGTPPPLPDQQDPGPTS